jgi:hypothetical protein
MDDGLIDAVTAISDARTHGISDAGLYQPGDAARRAGRYEEQNVVGTPTGRVAYAAEGEVMPPSPGGFAWRHVPVPEF